LNILAISNFEKLSLSMFAYDAHAHLIIYAHAGYINTHAH